MSVEPTRHGRQSDPRGNRRKGVDAVGRSKTWTRPLTALAFAIALGACTSEPASTAITPTAPDASEPTSSSAGSPSDPAAQPSNQEQIAALWEAVHTERLQQVRSDGEPDAAAFEPYATDDATQALLDHIHAARSDVEIELAGVEYWTEVAIAPSGDAADISDCLIIEERPTEQNDAEPTARTRVWTGTATETGDGWKLETVSAGIDHCVPPALNAELIDAYVAYHEAWTAAWDPPDPDHPSLEATMAGERLTEIRRQLEADLADGIAFRDPHDPLENAVVFDLGIGTATVSDCHEAHSGYGAFDMETGERRDDVIAPVEPGQLNLTSADFVRTDDGHWKVTKSGGLDRSNCQPGGTEYVVAP